MLHKTCLHDMLNRAVLKSDRDVDLSLVKIVNKGFEKLKRG